MDNFAIFSVKHDCVQQKQTSFDIPAAMPACTGDKCICGWSEYFSSRRPPKPRR